MANPIFVTDTTPSFCPSCGEEIKFFYDSDSRMEWLGGCSYFCTNCKTKYQYVKTEDILETADDLKYYYEKEL